MTQQTKNYQPVVVSTKDSGLSGPMGNGIDLRWSPDEDPKCRATYDPADLSVTILPTINIPVKREHLSDLHEHEANWPKEHEEDEEPDELTKECRVLDVLGILAVLEYFGLEYNYTNRRHIDQLWYYREVIEGFAYPYQEDDQFEDRHRVLFRGETMTRNEFIAKFHTFLVRLPATLQHSLYRTNQLY